MGFAYSKLNIMARLRHFRSPSPRIELHNRGRGYRSSRVSRLPKGYLPLYIGQGQEKYLVKVRKLNHPALAKMLEKSALEYGYSQAGALRIVSEPENLDLLFRILMGRA